MQTENQLHEIVRNIRFECVRLSKQLNTQLLECDFEAAAETTSEIQTQLTAAFTIEMILS